MTTAPRKPSTMHPLTVLTIALLLVVLGFSFFRAMRESPSEDPAPVSEPVEIPEVTDEEPPVPAETDTVLSPGVREIPGESPSRWLYYRPEESGDLLISGSWDAWAEKHELVPVSPGVYAFDVGALALPFGRYEFKFIHDREWEPGENRLLYVNEDGRIERPPRVIARALIDTEHLIRLQLNEAPANRNLVNITLEPDYGVERLEWVVPRHNPGLSGYRFVDNDVEFVFDPAVYDLSPAAVRRVSVAGVFNGWDPESAHARMTLRESGEWTVRIPYAYIDGKITDEHVFFKFVANGNWMNPPDGAPNRMLEPGTPHQNLTLPRGGEGRTELHVHTARAIDLRDPPGMIIQGLHERQLQARPTPGAILDTLSSDKAMGVTLERDAERTVFRLFAPRAIRVDLGLFDGPYHRTADNEDVPPAEILPMNRDEDGVWELALDGLRIGQYYAFRVEGPRGDGEGFNPNRWLGDPYAHAVSLAEGNSIVVDLDAIEPPFEGWSEAARALRIPWEDQVIYETHVRHFTWDESSGVQADLRGSYLGFLATEGLDVGLDHLKSLGVNVIQFMPIHEFPNGFEPRHDWGYATDFFFAPESSFALNPRQGSQIHEFRHLVNELKERGFAVFLDVVYNHFGVVNVFNAIDRKY